MSAGVRTHRIVDLLASVEGKDKGKVIVIQPLNVLIVEQHAICRQRQLKLLARVLFSLTDIGCDCLHCLYVHERLAAKEINLTVLAKARMLDEEIDCFTSCLCIHDRTPHAVVTAIAKAIFTPKIAVLCDHETEGLHKPLLLEGRRYIDIRPKELAPLDEFMKLTESLLDICLRVHIRKHFYRFSIVCAVKSMQNISNHFVDDMDSTAVDVEKKDFAALLKNMNLIFQSIIRSYKKGTALSCSPFTRIHPLSFSHRPGFRPCSSSCKRSGRKPGTHRSRLF